jgi:membrane associated rhomboid family serine protease
VLAVPMMRERPIQMIVIGFLLIFLPWTYFFLLTAHIIVLNNSVLSLISLMAAYAASVAGLLLGIIGAASYFNIKRKK